MNFKALFAKHKNNASTAALNAAVVSTVVPDATQTDLIAQLQADLTASQAAGEELAALQATTEASLLTVRAELAAKQTELETARAQHTAALAAKETEVNTRASAMAVDLAAGQGVPPAALPAVDGAAGNSTEKLATLRAELGKETDSRKRGLLAEEIRVLRHKN